MPSADFFDSVRRSLFGGSLTAKQVNGLNAIINGGMARDMPTDQLAYCLATAHHETAATMQPIKEYGGPGYFFRMYDPQSPTAGRAALARSMGARPGDGVIYFGRGYVQITWRVNYARMGLRLGLDLEGQPDLALQPGIAARIMFDGMELGMFTGRKLADYFGPSRTPDWHNARRIINGTDRAASIAGQARTYYAALLLA